MKTRFLKLLATSLILTTGLVSCNVNADAAVEQNKTSIKILNYSENNSIKSLGFDTESISKSFTYAILNGDASYNDLLVTVAYKDGTDCSGAVTSTIDLTNKTITLTCLKAFEKQIIVTLTCKVDLTIKASVIVDYRKKLSGITCNDFGTTDLIAISDYSKVPNFVALTKNVLTSGTLDYTGQVTATVNNTFTWADEALVNELHGHAVVSAGWDAYQSSFNLVDGYLHSSTTKLEDLTLDNLVGMLGYIKSKDVNVANPDAVPKCHFVSTVALSDGVYSKTFKVAWIDTWVPPTSLTTSSTGIVF